MSQDSKLKENAALSENNSCLLLLWAQRCIAIFKLHKSKLTDLWGKSAKTRLCAHNNNELRVLEFCSFFNPTTRLIDYKLCLYYLIFTPLLVLQYLCHVCHCFFNFLWVFQGFSSVKFSYPAWPRLLITFTHGLFVQSTFASFDCLLVNRPQQLNWKDFIDLILLWVLISLCINITEIHCLLVSLRNEKGNSK